MYYGACVQECLLKTAHTSDNKFGENMQMNQKYQKISVLISFFLFTLEIFFHRNLLVSFNFAQLITTILIYLLLFLLSLLFLFSFSNTNFIFIKFMSFSMLITVYCFGYYYFKVMWSKFSTSSELYQVAYEIPISFVSSFVAHIIYIFVPIVILEFFLFYSYIYIRKILGHTSDSTKQPQL